MPRMYMYWAKDFMVGGPKIFCKEVMTRSRFLCLLKFLSASIDLSMSEQEVVYLLGDLLDKGQHVVTDNWYTNLQLGRYLLTRDTLLTGVVRADRGPPKMLKNGKLARHQATFARNGNTLVVKYMDRKEVNVLTTQYTASIVEKTKTFFGDQTVFYNKPLHIEKYNNLMGSVDMAD
ncbi:PiggyBac transposable element-derived protein 4 [Portunus trituberculatus]|uniref:PiggyBac transposable element-derived protein 4 n=1 Tax=Portunus trituberculatus TaxID=210409 RepID=A0A5B7GPS1_PORTR|nr:PiggyBac transposable element-derived protein 4 [Portunus trituberculatus]